MTHDYLRKNNIKIINSINLSLNSYLLNNNNKRKKIGIIDYGITKNEYLEKKFKQIKFDNISYSWHGNAVAGMIGMIAENDSSIYSYQVKQKASINYKEVLELLYKAVKDNMDIINISMSMVINIKSKIGKKTLEDWNKAINYANSNGVIIIVSAGNLGINLDNIYPYKILPAMLNKVITVGSSYKGKHTDYSNFGKYVNEYIYGGDKKDQLLTCANQYINIDYSMTNNLKKGFIRAYGTSLSSAILSGYITNIK